MDCQENHVPRYPVTKRSQKAVSFQGNMVQKIIKKIVAEIPRLNWNLSENRNAQDNEQMIQLNEGHNIEVKVWII